MSNLDDDLPPEIRDQKNLIADGLIDEFEALEELKDEEAAQSPTATNRPAKPDKPLSR